MRSCVILFFFFKQKTAYEMRISDWSSDVCSSDLLTAEAFGAEIAALRADPALDSLARAFWLPRIEPSLRWAAERVWAERVEGREPIEIGRASCRERVCQYV